MNLNKLAVEICKHEGKKKQVDIAQIKEVLRVLIDILSDDISSAHSYIMSPKYEVLSDDISSAHSYIMSPKYEVFEDAVLDKYFAKQKKKGKKK